VLYGSETWILKEQDKSRITATEMKFLRKIAKYTLFDHKRNHERTQNAVSSGKNQQLQAQTDTTCLQNGQV
jgi:hypothetical protein